MLKNMKVGTKLIAVLVAPVLVLVILASIGVSQRLDTASKAKRVEQLAEMAAADANLAHEIQREAVFSAAYMSERRQELDRRAGHPAQGHRRGQGHLQRHRSPASTRARTPTT